MITTTNRCLVVKSEAQQPFKCIRASAHPRKALNIAEKLSNTPLPLLQSRRQLLIASVAVSTRFLPSPLLPAAQALPLRSIQSTDPAVVLFQNNLNKPLKLVWITYDGDAELYAWLNIDGSLTIDTYKTHPWRIEDANGNIIHEFIVTEPDMVVDINSSLVSNNTVSDSPTSTSTNGNSSNKTNRQQQQQQQLDSSSFEGFDGVGGNETDYVRAQISELSLDHLGGLVLLTTSTTNNSSVFPLPVGVNEAASLFHSAPGVEFRRPTTFLTWSRTLIAVGGKVERVVLTRQVGSTYYARVVLSSPSSSSVTNNNSSPNTSPSSSSSLSSSSNVSSFNNNNKSSSTSRLVSIDATPADAIAVAMQTDAPVYIAKRLIKAQKDGFSSKEGVQRPPVARVPPMEGLPQQEALPPALKSGPQLNNNKPLSRGNVA